MKHPFQNIISSDRYLFTSVKNHLQAYNLETGEIVGSWKDTVGIQDVLKKQQLAKIEQLESKASDTTSNEPGNDSKRSETNKKVKIPKIPTPGPGAPPIYNYLRDLELTNDYQYLIGITDSDKSIVIFKLDYDNKQNILQLYKRQVFPKRPCSISIADNNSTVVIGDKFGDVYKIPIQGESVPEKDLKPILGHVSMLTDVLITENKGKQYILTSDRDEHIKVSNYPITYVVNHWLFGHDEFISSMVQLEFNRELLISGGGDDYIYLWNWFENKLIFKFPIRDLLQPLLNDFHLPPERFLHENSPKEISVVKLLPIKNLVIVLFEKVNALLVLNVNNNSLEFVELFKLEHPLIDLTIVNDHNLIGSVDSEDLLISLKFDGKLEIEPKDFKPIVNANPCEVNSRDEFYPLYTMNSLRKRSEH